MGGEWSVLRLAVLGLIITSVTVVVCVTVLLYQGDSPPDGLIAIGGGAVGALATLMTTRAYGESNQQPH